MNILFVYSINDIKPHTRPLRNWDLISFGISYISALLKKHRHQTKLIVLAKIFNKRSRRIIDDCLKDFRPQLICFTAVSAEYKFIVSMAQYIKERNPDIYLIIGGPHASLNPFDVPLDLFNAVCVGEGEYPVLELVSQLEQKKQPGGIPNLWIKRGSVIEKNPPRQFLQDLDNLPFPDRQLWKEWVEEKARVYSIQLGRGCPFECRYCCNHAFKKLAAGPYVRLRSAGSIVKEIEDILINYPGMKEIYFEVETMAVNLEWAVNLCSALERFNSNLKQPIPFGTNIRVVPGVDLEPLFAAFKKSNFKFINVGLESGSERLRREVLKRNYSNQDIINTVNAARKYGLKVNFYNLIGFPGETLNDFMETVKINRICQPDELINYIFYPYPGTDLYFLCKEQGLIDDSLLDITAERRIAVLNTKDFSKKQIQRSYALFYYYVYRGYRPLFEIFRKVALAKISSWPRFDYWFNYFYEGIKSIIPA